MPPCASRRISSYLPSRVPLRVSVIGHPTNGTPDWILLTECVGSVWSMLASVGSEEASKCASQRNRKRSDPDAYLRLVSANQSDRFAVSCNGQRSGERHTRRRDHRG